MTSTWRIVSVLVLGTATAGAWSLGLGRGDEPKPVPHQRVAGMPELFDLGPGLVVDDGPPEGWSHLVIKSIPRLATGDVSTLPASAAATAGLFRTVILADVAPEADARHGFLLRRIGMGLCLPDRGHDRVVTAASLESLGISLGTVPRIVLDHAERELAQGRIAARTPTFALFLAPTNLAVDGEHHRVTLAYAILVDPETGALRSAVGTIAEPAGKLIVLRPALIFDCGLDVAAKRVFGRLPISWSFAMGSLPPGRLVSLPKGWPTDADDALLTQDEAAALERDLREALD